MINPCLCLTFVKSVNPTIWSAWSPLCHLFVWCQRYDYVQKTNEGCFVQLATLDTEKPILFLGHLERIGHSLRWWGCIDDERHSGTLNMSLMMVRFKTVSKKQHVEWKLGVLSFPGCVFFSVLVGIRLYQNRFHRSRMREMIDPSCLRVENEVHFADGFPWQQPNYVDYVPKGTHL